MWKELLLQYGKCTSKDRVTKERWFRIIKNTITLFWKSNHIHYSKMINRKCCVCTEMHLCVNYQVWDKIQFHYIFWNNFVGNISFYCFFSRKCENFEFNENTESNSVWESLMKNKMKLRIALLLVCLYTIFPIEKSVKVSVFSSLWKSVPPIEFVT